VHLRVLVDRPVDAMEQSLILELLQVGVEIVIARRFVVHG
jgi:hypothetical protein